MGAGGFGDAAFHDFQDLFGGFGDIFEEIFGGGRSRRRSTSRHRRGNDLRYDLEISLEEAYRGVEKPIQVPKLINCDAAVVRLRPDINRKPVRTQRFGPGASRAGFFSIS